ncbi:MAG TPA: hypothetical protein VFN56_01495 [Candidatus Saccharimonadales bacterium]|nr:hypothetical protein [Candidatus Saccharimonadales bacterium]
MKAILYVGVMVAIIGALDIFVLRHHFWARLLINVAIVLLFLAGYFLLKVHP